MKRPWLPLLLTAALVGCARSPQPAPSPDVSAVPAGAAQASARATVGQPAPDFTLRGLDGAETKLSSLRGKTVVIEWFNPECPFVKASHEKGSLRELAKKVTASGVVWLAVNSGAPGKQGHSPEANRAAVAKWSLSHPVLRDEDGAVGRAYGATNTPQMFVVDSKGTLVYRGAIDNSPDGEGESPAGGKLVNHVEAALADLSAGRPVATPDTRPYGCSVKYGR